MWSFLPVVENKKRRGGFHIRPQCCITDAQYFLAERSDANHRIYYFLFIIYYL